MPVFGEPTITFKKSGSEIKAAVERRLAALRKRLDYRNLALEKLLDDRNLLRSYLIRSSNMSYDMHTGRGYLLSGRDDISSEQMEEIKQLCQRILEIEQEMRHLEIVSAHIADNQVFEIGYADLVTYGFDVE